MIKTQKIRMPVDILMTLLSILLMGASLFFPDDRVHQILGMLLISLWIIHIILNRRWYGSIFKGKYNPYRIIQNVINISLLVCTVLLGVSGIMMAWFIPQSVNVPLGFARTTHLICSHWYYVYMSLHLGMHINIIYSRVKGKNTRQSPALKKIIFRIILALICTYGIYAFIVRGVGKYMLLLQEFFFLDLEKGFLLFALDYLSILVLIATAGHCLEKFVSKKK